VPRIIDPDALTVTVRAVNQMDPYLWEIWLTLPGGQLRRAVIPVEAATVEGVRMVAAAVAALSVPRVPLGYG
jgi:hypothetical protein